MQGIGLVAARDGRWRGAEVVIGVDWKRTHAGSHFASQVFILAGCNKRREMSKVLSILFFEGRELS